MTPPLVTPISSDIIPPLNEKGISKNYLVQVKTPSSFFWDIAHYDAGYKKKRPWLNAYGHGLTISFYYELPELRE